MKNCGRKDPANAGCQPDSSQRLLLQAAISEGDRAKTAWLAWRANADIERLDNGSYGLLPQVWLKLQSQGFEDDWFPRMQGMYRLTAVRNRLHLNCLKELAYMFQAANVPLLVVEGTALLVSCHRDPGAYPLSALTVFVSTSDLGRVADLLTAAGWTAKRPNWRQRVEVTRGARFIHTMGLLLQVYWRDVFTRDEKAPWSSTVEGWADETPIRMPSLYEQFFQTCLHATIWNEDFSFRWVADALAILQSVPDWDWESLIQQAKRHEQIFILPEMLRCLNGVAHRVVPEYVFAELTHRRPMKSENRIFRALGLPPAITLWFLLAKWSLFANAFHEHDWIWKTLHFPAYLTYEWGLDHVWQIPGYMTGRSRREAEGKNHAGA